MSYTVELIRGCRVVRGRATAREISSLLIQWADAQRSSAPLDEMVADHVLAGHFGATIVCGTLGAVNTLRKELEL
jgi:hypothetical protein